MDKRKKYILVIDTETANGFMGENGKLDLSNSLVYDIGYKVIDKKGKTYEENSFVIYDIFFNKEMMQSAYYKQKIPRYLKDIEEGKKLLEENIFIKDMNDCRLVTLDEHNNRSSKTKILESLLRLIFPLL